MIKFSILREVERLDEGHDVALLYLVSGKYHKNVTNQEKQVGSSFALARTSRKMKSV